VMQLTRRMLPLLLLPWRVALVGSELAQDA